MKWFRRFLGSAVILFGVVWSIFSIIAIVDPVGTQLADDSDPFGPPPSLTFSLIHLGVGFGIIGAGAWFASGSARSNGDRP